MARQCCLLLLVAVAVTAFGVAGASKDVTGGYLLNDCDPDPRRSTKGTSFGASLRSLLATLPSVAAPTGYASLRSGRGNGTAFARGICFGESPARGDCRECLAIAVERSVHCDGSRRAAFWNDGCFLAYTDANTTEEDGDERRWMSFMTQDPAVYPRFYDVETLAGLARSLVPLAAAANATLQANGTARMLMLAAASAALQANSTVRAVAQCPPWNVTAAECALCLYNSVQDFPEILKTYDGARPGVASVHRYRCNLRLEISAPELLPVGVEARIRKRRRNYLIISVVGTVAIVAAIIAAIIAGVVALVVMKRRKKMRKEAQADISTTPS